MHYSILGDIQGSTLEKIPHFQQRTNPTPTDDTFLTCACFDFLNSLSTEELNFPTDYKQAILIKAINSLRFWYFKFPNEGGFSNGFTQWCKRKDFVTKEASTNGCLMRQSPIPLFCFVNNISLENTLTITQIFCSTTHNSSEALFYSKLHVTLLFLSLSLYQSSDISKDSFSQLLTTPSVSELIQPSSYWNSQSKITKNDFIWDAKQSLGISLSSIHYSSSWREMFNFLSSCSNDVDTYAAISAPFAQIYFPPIKETAFLHILKSHSKFTDIVYTYNSMKDLWVNCYS